MATRPEGRTVSEAIVPAPVEGISGIWKFRREPGGYRRARSLPGHLLHLVLTGDYRLRTNAREYRVRAGNVIYYHETEDVEWLGNSRPVEFYSVGFLAPGLEPLPPEARVFPSTPPVRAAFERLHRAAPLPEGAARAVAVHAALLDVIVNVAHWRHPKAAGPSPGAESWWELERLIRERRLFRPTLEELGRLSNRSRASVVRACRAATGESPMRRLREIRMAEARGLLRFSTLNIGGVAAYLGYPRVHEFSREFARRFGKPPSALRRG